MKIQRPDVIRAHHLARKAIVYVRQSSDEQVLKNQGSTEAQRGQEALARSWGWRRDQVEVIDEDLGLSGSAIEHRTGYLRMLEDIRAGRVGVVLLTDHTRAGRRSIEWFELLEDFERHDVLMAINGTVYDAHDAGTMLASKIQAVFGEHENRVRRAHMERGRMAKITAGKTVTHPPVGYMRLPDGSWIRDPDAAVQQGVSAVFRAFLRARSLRATVQLLQRDAVRVPRRRAGHPVGWVQPSVSAVQRIITNPNFTGDYVWGRRRSDPKFGRDRRGRLRARRVESSRVVRIPNHHEPYVTLEEWREVQRILAENRWNGPRPGGLGRGAALLQGVIRCRVHRGRRMAPAYKNKRANGTSPHAYHCLGEHHEGGKQCGHRPGGPIDAVIVEALLTHLAVPSIETLREMWREAKRDAQADARLHLDDLRRAEVEVEDLMEKFLSIDAEHRLVLAEIERRLEDAKRRVGILRDRADQVRVPVALFTEDAFQDLLTIAPQLPMIWAANTTTVADRKELVRAMIKAVYVERFDREHIALTIEWLDGSAPSQHEVVLPPRAHRLIAQWMADGADPATIATRLGALGIRTKYGTAWTPKAVDRAWRRIKRSGEIESLGRE